MAEEPCPSCGTPLAARAGRTGRRSVYCSAAGRQKAYRERQGTADVGVHALIKEIGRQVEDLVPQPPSVFSSGVSELSSAVARLRRVARTARDTTQETVTLFSGTPSPPPPQPATPATPASATPASATPASATPASATPASATPEPATPETVPPELVTPLPVTEVALDESDFAALVESYRRELRVHCYRMTGSYDGSEDLVQETFLRAWRARSTFQGRAGARTWLYRIATNACLDFQRRTARRPQRYAPLPGMNHGGGEPPARITWLQPYPDDELPSADQRPEAAAESRETLELVFLAAVQHLPPRQRAVLVLRDEVLDVLRFGADDRIVEITSFEPHLFPAFGLPLRL
ncbi:sigma-70 family RNA polymerase sigma factor [Streptomyces sp. NPDC005423]|uniref:sigma-70 family RNA polymerase sigma factor n=1 Tax=Streptomyces sp. NPDC005423 TaxID=3155343 RepID=UPI0033BBBB13